MKYIKTYEGKIESKMAESLRYSLKKAGCFLIEISSTFAGNPLIDHFHVGFCHETELFKYLKDYVDQYDIYNGKSGDKKYPEKFYRIFFDVYHKDIETINRILRSENPKERAQIEKEIGKYNL
jgi:hypothetical protein